MCGGLFLLSLFSVYFQFYLLFSPSHRFNLIFENILNTNVFLQVKSTPQGKSGKCCSPLNAFLWAICVPVLQKTLLGFPSEGPLKHSLQRECLLFLFKAHAKYYIIVRCFSGTRVTSQIKRIWLAFHLDNPLSGLS